MDKPFWAFLLLLSCSYTAALADDPTSESKGWGDVAPAPSETECRSFIEAALKEQRTHEEAEPEIEGQTEDGGTISEAEIDRADQVTEETADEASTEDIESKEANETEAGDRNESADLSAEEAAGTAEVESEETAAESAEIVDSKEEETPAEPASEEAETAEQSEGEVDASEEKPDGSGETDASVETENEQTIESAAAGEDKSVEADAEGEEAAESTETENAGDAEAESREEEAASAEQTGEVEASPDTAEETSTEQESEGVKEEVDQITEQEQSSTEGVETEEVAGSTEVEEETQDEQQSVENQDAETSIEEQTDANESEPEEKVESTEDVTVNDATEEQTSDAVEQSEEEQQAEQSEEGNEVEAASEVSGESAENQGENIELEASDPSAEEVTEEIQETESAESQPIEEIPSETPAENTEEASVETPDEVTADLPVEAPTEISAETESPETVTTNEEQQATSHSETGGEQAVVEEEVESPEQEDLTLRIEIPENLRPRDHIFEVLRLDTESVGIETKLLKAEETTLKDLKRLYEAAIKPLEILYKYRDLSNRHFGDPEIFSKPLILFMGPWSGGKSTIINYLLDNEYTNTALRTGAEPSPAYFNIVMWGEREEIMDGTQLAADWTFSGLQKFGQGLLDRLRGLRLNNPLLEKVNIVEIPGILEIRKQVERLFPLNDACQWFIDRADIIFLVYDPAKLDVGPETEAILDQLKGREYQTKIILNKADQVKPEELMRVQGTLIWNISPLMSSTEPPVMYSTSLWSHAYKSGAPSRLLFAQEKAFLKDLREAVDKRVENKISSARRFAVRVRNHAKMVDCYLTTYYNHKSFFGNKQTVSNDIIEHPQNYHIYEGLSTLTNISRYDLPDPDVYRDFFRLNPVYDFQQLASTCTYFRGCPINRLDVAIAYDLPELVGKYKKIAEDIVKTSSKSTGKK